MSEFSSQTAIITGGGGGVGAAIALALAAEKANLCLIGRRLDNLQAVADEGRRYGVDVECLHSDLANDAELRDLSKSLASRFASVRALVHSAGTITRGTIDRAALEDFDHQYRVNVRAPYALTQALIPALRASGGDVVFINSSAGMTAKPQFAQYDSTKHALKAIADCLRGEVNTNGVRVLSVYLGRTATDMQAKLYADDGKSYRPEFLLQPVDVASVIVNALRLPRTAEVTDIHIRPAIKS